MRERVEEEILVPTFEGYQGRYDPGVFNPSRYTFGSCGEEIQICPGVSGKIKQWNVSSFGLLMIFAMSKPRSYLHPDIPVKRKCIIPHPHSYLGR